MHAAIRFLFALGALFVLTGCATHEREVNRGRVVEEGTIASPDPVIGK